MLAGNFQCLFPSAKVIIKVALATLKERNEKREDGRKKKIIIEGKENERERGKERERWGEERMFLRVEYFSMNINVCMIFNKMG